jgi:ABC-type Fe3+ transport system substrate-binding protein
MKRTPASFVAALVLTGAVGAPAVAADRFGPHITALIAEAQKEGKLQLSWSGGSFGENGKGMPAWIDAFNRFYGMHLTYTYTPAPTMTQQATAVIQAAQSNTPAATDDVILGAENLVLDVRAKALKSYDWAALAKEIGATLPAEAIGPGNSGVGFATEVYGITYNKNSVAPADVPQTLSDVLKPAWKGRIAGEAHAAGFADLAVFNSQWSPAKAEDTIKKLERQIGGIIRCGDSAPLLSGQFDMMVMECDLSSAILAQRRGVPIGYMVPKDAALTGPWYMAVPKTAPDPAAAALLAIFMMTKEGQQVAWDAHGGDLAQIKGSHMAAFVPRNATNVTAQDYLAKPEAAKLYEQYANLITGMSK